MIAVSNDFKTAMQQPVKELDAYIRIDNNNSITSSDDLIEIKVSCESDMCKTAMRKVEAKFLGEHNILDTWVHIGFGVKLPNSTYEYLDYGSFKITEISTAKETGVTSVVGYDKMINSMKAYEILEVEYPINLYDYTETLLDACDLELGNTTLPMGTWEITKELWENINGITYRDILVQIAQINGATCIIGNDDKVYFKALYDTGEQLTYANMKSWKLEPLYGEINSVVLARTPQEDNIYEKDDESILENGLTEFRIENNEIVDKDRDTALPLIYPLFHGISYYPFEISTEGLGWFEIGDQFDIVNDSQEEFNTALFNFSITIDGGIKETLKTTADNKVQTQYQYASPVMKRIKNTEIIVDKQEGNISFITSETNKLKDNTYTITQVNDLIQNAETGFTNTFTEAGGNNIFRNTGLWFENSGDDSQQNPYEFWNGVVVRQKEEKASNMNALILQNGEVSQEQVVPNGNYVVSFKYKKLLSLATAKVFINGEEYELTQTDDTEFITGTQNENGEYIISPLVVVSQHINIKFTCDRNDGCEVYDLMVNAGKVKLAYSQNQNETTTDTVNISKGITITSSDSKVTFKANADGIRTLDKSGNELTKFTDTGMTTEEATIKAKSTIVGTLWQKVSGQTWITGI